MEQQIISFLTDYGTVAIFAATLLEYACFPISSEIVLPVCGMIAARMGTPYILVVLISVLAGLIGSSACYVLGRCSLSALEKALNRFPKMAASLEKTCNWQRRHGKVSVLVARLIPLFRTYISFVSGMVKQSYLQFLGFSSIGITLWNCCLIGAGYILGETSGSFIVLIERFLIFMATVLILSFVIRKYFSYRKSKI